MKDNEKILGLLSDDELKKINNMNIDLESNATDEVTSAGAAAGAAAGAGFMLMGM